VVAARLLVHGVNPWQAERMNYVGRMFPLFYPMTAVLVALPFAWLANRWADVMFMTGSAGALAWTLTRTSLRNPQLLVFVSFAWFFALDTVQWSPLLMAAALVPSLGFLFTGKPTIGLALLAGYPSRKAIIGCAAFGLLTLLIAPGWIRDWLHNLARGESYVPPVLMPGGFLMLLAAVKWRRREARLLTGLALVPHSLGLNEAVLLFLVVQAWWEGAALVVLTPIVWLLTRHDQTVYPTIAAMTVGHGVWQLWLLYLPCVLMVLRRPNV
jgi:hypothetical protein